MDLYPCQIFGGHDEMSKSKNNRYKRIYHMKVHMKGEHRVRSIQMYLAFTFSSGN